MRMADEAYPPPPQVDTIGMTQRIVATECLHEVLAQTTIEGHGSPPPRKTGGLPSFMAPAIHACASAIPPVPVGRCSIGRGGESQVNAPAPECYADVGCWVHNGNDLRSPSPTAFDPERTRALHAYLGQTICLKSLLQAAGAI